MAIRGGLAAFGRILLLILFIPLILLFIPVILFLNLMGWNKSRAGPDYVIGFLESFIAGNESGYDWDDFCSIPLKDPELDDIRERACRYEPPYPMEEAERDELRALLEEARAIECARR